MITRALGTEADVDVDTFTVQAEAGDLFLICSDGLSAMLPDAEILRIVEAGAAASREAWPRRSSMPPIAPAARTTSPSSRSSSSTAAEPAEPDAADRRVGDCRPATGAAAVAAGRRAGQPARRGPRRPRSLALAAILLALAAAALLVWWGVVR